MSDDTWEFDGTRWQKRDVVGPGRMFRHAMAYDESRRLCVVAITGRDASQTWNWDGVAWRQELIPRLPVRSDGVAMAYHSGLRSTMFHGGLGFLDSSDPFSDFWQKSGAGPWVRLAIYTMPERYRHGMIYDRDRGRIVVFSGETASLGYHTDTWEWDGRDWRKILPASAPDGRSEMGFVYHEGLRKPVLFGGDFTDSSTWLWDGQTWERRSIPGPQVRGAGVMIYDSKRDRVVLHGGSTGFQRLDDTWVLVPACPANCTGDAGPGGTHQLDIQDFTCFQNAFALGDLAKADLAGGPPAPGTPAGCAPDGELDIRDFICFQNLFALGCP